MNLEDYDRILIHGYPSHRDLARFPLGNMLKQLDLLAWSATARNIELSDDEPDYPTKRDLEQHLKEANRMLPSENLGEIYRTHIKGVMKGINYLTGNHFTEIFPIKGADYARSPYKEYVEFLNGLSEDLKRFLRFVAFYHDIGKVIHRDRHPVLGKHVLESLSDDDTRQLKETLRISGEDWLYLMIQLIGHHDLFGVLCTGEGSRPVLLDALRLKKARTAIGCLATLNLADIYGTLGKITPTILETVLGDWLFVINLLDGQSAQEIAYRSVLEKEILSQSQEQESTTERIRRLIITAVDMVRNANEADKITLTRSITSDVVLDALKNRLGPELIVFCYDFALVCKFDYTLRFIVNLVSRWIYNQMQASSAQDIDVKGIAAIIVEILARLVTNYRDLTRHREGWPRRIGIELLTLTRADEISERVIDLLLSDRRTEGVNWIADEATAWYFI